MQVAKAVADAEDWNRMLINYSVFASQTAQWTGAISRLLPILKDLIDLNVAAADKQRASGDAAIHGTRNLMLAIIAIAVVVLTGLGLTVARSVISALNAIRSTISEVAHNNDFTRRAPVRGHDEAAHTAQAFSQLLERIQQSLREVATNTRTVSEAAAHMTETVAHMTTRISQINTSTRDTLARAEEARSAAHAGADCIGQTTREMELVAEDITRAGETVGDLGRESEHISNVISVIKEVADQTNLLALNASIEAARAGEHGRGFAVVADEVRKLAERTSASAQQIGDIIESMQSAARSAVGHVDAVVARAQGSRSLSEAAAGQILQIRDSTRHVTTAVDEVAAALATQDQAASGISQRVDTIARMTEDNCAAGARTATVSESLAEAAQALRANVERFKV